MTNPQNFCYGRQPACPFLDLSGRKASARGPSALECEVVIENSLNFAQAQPTSRAVFGS